MSFIVWIGNGDVHDAYKFHRGRWDPIGVFSTTTWAGAGMPSFSLAEARKVKCPFCASTVEDPLFKCTLTSVNYWWLNIWNLSRTWVHASFMKVV